MIELLVEIDFECCNCEFCVGVKLKCEGKGLEDGGGTVAAVNVPCPNCHNVNQVLFEPYGVVRAVRPFRALGRLPEPSLN